MLRVVTAGFPAFPAVTGAPACIRKISVGAQSPRFFLFV
jgi:hypothetical protein